MSMTPDDLKARTKKFAVDVILFAKAIPADPINREIAKQQAERRKESRIKNRQSTTNH
jgi:hypothetical protein